MRAPRGRGTLAASQDPGGAPTSAAAGEPRAHAPAPRTVEEPRGHPAIPDGMPAAMLPHICVLVLWGGKYTLPPPAACLRSEGRELAVRRS